MSGPTVLEVVGKVDRGSLGHVAEDATVIEDDDGDYKIVEPAEDGGDA